MFDVIMHTHIRLCVRFCNNTTHGERVSKERDEVRDTSVDERKNKSGRRDGFINFLSDTMRGEQQKLKSRVCV